jgi:pSer/pThr/pTyr-binding forkhead associated (FHA) protein
MAKLKFLSGPLRGSEHDFDSELVIGRADADLDIDDPQISRRHLRLRCVSGAVLVEDLDSSNGTFLDNRRLTAVATVRSTAIIGIGQTKFELIGSEARVDATQLASAGSDRTRISDRPPAADGHTAVTPPPQPPRAAPPAPPPAPEAPAVPAAPIGVYTAVAPPRPRRGPATRLLAPAALTALIIIAVAAALLVYFATR